MNLHLMTTENNEKKSKIDFFLVAAIIAMVCNRIFWIIVQKIDYWWETLLVPTFIERIIMSLLPLLLSLGIKNKTLKVISFIISILYILYAIYEVISEAHIL